MKKDVRVFLEHILESITKIEGYVGDLSKERFMELDYIQDAVIRRLEIIGEAVKNVPEEFRNKHSKVPWSEISKMRDKLIHKYFGVDLELTWDVVKDDLPDLKQRIKKMLGD